MALNDKFNRERLYGDIEKLNQGSNIRDGSRQEKLTDAQKRKARVHNNYSRQSWRRYNDGNEIKYFSVVFRETLIAAFALAFYGLYIVAFILGLSGNLVASHESAVLATLVGGGMLAAIFAPHMRRLFKRLNFMRKLRRTCRRNGMRLYIYRGALRSLYHAGNRPDFAVECGDTVYECMFFPCRRRLTILRFQDSGKVKIVTGILRSRLKEAMGLNEHVRERDFGFEPLTSISNHTLIKAVILHPVPYQLFYYDKKDGCMTEGGSGSEVFGYTLFSSTGFINELTRRRGS